MQMTGKWKEMWTLITIISRPAHHIFKTSLLIMRQNQVVRSRTQLQLWHRIHVTRRYYRHPTFALDFFLIIPDTSQHAESSLFVLLWIPCVIEIRMLIEWYFSCFVLRFVDAEPLRGANLFDISRAFSYLLELYRVRDLLVIFEYF